MFSPPVTYSLAFPLLPLSAYVHGQLARCICLSARPRCPSHPTDTRGETMYDKRLGRLSRVSADLCTLCYQVDGEAASEFRPSPPFWCTAALSERTWLFSLCFSAPASSHRASCSCVHGENLEPDRPPGGPSAGGSCMAAFRSESRSQSLKAMVALAWRRGSIFLGFSYGSASVAPGACWRSRVQRGAPLARLAALFSLVCPTLRSTRGPGRLSSRQLPPPSFPSPVPLQSSGVLFVLSRGPHVLRVTCREQKRDVAGLGTPIPLYHLMTLA